MNTKKPFSKFLATTLLLVASTGPILADDFATGEEIYALLNGNTLQGSSTKVNFAEYYDPDGTIRGDGYTAKWKVEGDAGCMDYDGKGFKCWTAKIDGNANIWYKNGKVDAAGMMVPGNPNKF